MESGEELISVVGEFKPKGIPGACTFSHLHWPGKVQTKKQDITKAHLVQTPLLTSLHLSSPLFTLSSRSTRRFGLSL
jgi:hypothetical protein